MPLTKIPTKKINLIPMNVYLYEHQIKGLHQTMNTVIPKMKGIPAEIKGLNSLINRAISHFFNHYSLLYRSFKGANRKRPRTETAEGAAEVKKEEKEDKEVNGENKEGTSKETVKDSDKKNETTLKSSGESSSEGSALSMANEIKG